MVGFPFAILGVLFLAVVVAAVVTGIALLIAGVATKRRGVWVTGLVVLLVSLGFVLALGVAGLLWFWAAAPTRAAPPPAAITAVAAPTIENALALPPGVNAPGSARMLPSSAVVDGTELSGRAVIQAGPDFQPLLGRYFEKVTWDRIAPLITTPHFDPDDSEWTEARLGKLECYQRIAPNRQGRTRQVALCRDRQNGRVYCAWIEKP